MPIFDLSYMKSPLFYSVILESFQKSDAFYFVFVSVEASTRAMHNTGDELHSEFANRISMCRAYYSQNY